MENQTGSRKIIKPFACTQALCKRAFRDQKELLEHLKAHKLTKQSTSEASSHNDLSENLELSHGEEKLHRCDACDQSFTQISNLRRHERVHKGERPYGCEFCSKRFSTSSNHKQHMLVHQEKDDRSKFLCEICNTSYFYKASLKKHMKSHQEGAEETHEVPKKKVREVQAPSKKVFITPTTNIEIPAFDNQASFDQKKKDELISFWELNNNEYLKQNPVLFPNMFPMMMLMNAQHTLRNYEYLLTMLYNSKAQESSEAKESSDTLSNSSRVSKEKGVNKKVEQIMDDAENVNNHGIKIPRPIRPQRS